jgi:S-adenosylmethionine-dependent methyltransferase
VDVPSYGAVAVGAGSVRQRGVLHVVIDVLSSFDRDTSELAVLDCGGGSGGLAVPVAELGASVTVVDVSVDALATLTRRAAEAGVADRVRAVQGDLEALVDVVGEAEFDLVLAHDVLDVVDSRAALASVAAAVRPGGFISLLISNPVAGVLAKVLAGDLAAALTELQADTVGAEASRRLDATSLARLCTDAGLIVDHVQGVGVFTELIPAGAVATGSGRDVADIAADMEELAAALSPYRDIASRVHLLVRRPAPGSSDGGH